MVVTPEHLDSILLTSAEINVVMSAAHMQSNTISYDLQHADTVSDPNCVAATDAAQDPVYRGSGFTAISRTWVREPGKNPDHFVGQAAASFLNAHDALEFVKTSAAKLSGCAGHSLTSAGETSAFRDMLGPLAGTPPKVSLTWTQEGGDGWRCQRALHAVLNLVLDVAACGLHVTDQANQIADKMAAKIPQHQSSPASPQTDPAQTQLPFTGLADPAAIALDAAGNVYVADGNGKRVLKLSAGSNTPTVLAFTGLAFPNAVAVDTVGNVYIVDADAHQVVKLPAGSNTQVVLPFTGLSSPWAVAVDTAGGVYVADGDNNSVVELPPGSKPQLVLPFTGLKNPGSVHVDGAGTVYVGDDSNRVFKLPAGSNTQAVLPFTGLNDISDFAVDAAGNVYVASRHTDAVLKLAAGSQTQTELPFSGLSGPSGVAVSAAGEVYVSDEYNNRVVKLPQH